MLSEGTVLGRYRVDRHVATGGMGAVYRATDPVLARPVALKVLPADRAGDPSMAQRFVSEALQAAALRHPNVLPVYDAGEAEGVRYVAMQWVDGATLEQLAAAEGPFDLERATTFVDAIASALDHAHDQGLVHRDVKPGNVMVDSTGHVYLMDFGLSVRADRTSALTRTGEFLATVDYAAPEQIEGEAVDRRTDVYALGALAFRVLTGRVPFDRDGAIARLRAHLEDEPPAAHDLRPAVPSAASDAIRRALAKRPDDRPASAGAFAAELRAAIGGAPAGRATQPTAVMPVARRAPSGAAGRRFRPRLVAGVAAAVLAALGGIALAAISGGGSPSGDEPAGGATTRPAQTTRTATSPVTGPTEPDTATPAAAEAGQDDGGKKPGKGKGRAKGGKGKGG